MSTAAPEIESPERKKPKPYGKTPGMIHFWLRRAHSLMGILFGGYITIHLLVNFTGFWPKTFQQNVDKIHSLQPVLPVVELLFIFIPLLLHVIYGIWIATVRVKFNTIKYNYGGNIRYFLQRFTGIILLAFLVYHIGTLHHWGFALINKNFVPYFTPTNSAYQSTASAVKEPYFRDVPDLDKKGNPKRLADGSIMQKQEPIGWLNNLVKVAYLLGVLAAVFHWANGIWTAAIAWGLTVTARSQKLWGHVCLGFGIFMLFIGVGAWVAFAIYGDPQLDPSATTTIQNPESH